MRLTKELPEIKQKLDQGLLTFSTLTMAYKTVRSKSTEEKRKVIEKLENLSSREAKKILAMPAPAIKIKESVYQEKVVLRLELSHEQHQKLEKLKALKSHSGNLESLLEKWIDVELAKYANTNFKPSTSKNPRQVSICLRNSALKSAQYKCQFPGCDSDHFLQIDHVQPVRHGGQAQLNNLQVLCQAHNLWKG